MYDVFVSFDWDYDRHYKHLLEAWHENPMFDFVFNDATPTEINSSNVGRVKAAITVKINSATHTLVIVGQHANDLHMDHRLIGFRNWINFEVHQSVLAGNHIAVVKLERHYTPPDELLGVGAAWAYGFSEYGILDALRRA